jgi:tetraacyldisaccharide 4'-kinase
MTFLKNKILKIIYSDNTKNPFLSLRFILFFLSKLYSFVSDLRIYLYKKNILKSYKSSSYVISVGNISAGGTGKTPMAVYLSKFFISHNLNPVIVMRGYKGRFEKTGGIACNGKEFKAEYKDAGDEAVLLCSKLSNVPVLCGADKKKSVIKAEKEFKADVIIIDDGFSHLKIKRDLDLVLIDYEKPFGNFYTLPRGILREKKDNIKRADAVIYTRTDRPQISFNNTFFSFHESVVEKIKPGLKSLKNDKPFLFSGLGNNKSFYSSAVKLGYTPGGCLFFDDHHEYKIKDLENIIKKAKEKNCDCFLTSNKDYCRLENLDINLPFDLIVLDAEIKFYCDAFEKFLKKRLKLN